MDNTEKRWRPISGKTAYTTLMAAAIALAGICPAQSADTPACNRVVITGDPAYPPFSWYENGMFYGSAIEIVKIALDRIHLPYEIRYVGPFLRVLNEAKLGTVDIVAELKNTPERQKYLSFSRVPIFMNPVAVFTRADQGFNYGRWEDLIPLHGGITLGNKFGGGFDEFLTSRLKVEPADRISLNFAKLTHQRIDYFVNSYYPALTYLIKENKEAQYRALQPFVTNTSNFVGWSSTSPCIGRLADFDAALAAMVKSGEVPRIMDASLKMLRTDNSKK